ncbi:hypothetical protein T492DRAFT_1000119 [Pavlovales sp. CCMP2436]|nr:hypothetical protein T492DRAFT_1000119 [Pavlovales sp. CCMP2436]
MPSWPHSFTLALVALIAQPSACLRHPAGVRAQRPFTAATATAQSERRAFAAFAAASVFLGAATAPARAEETRSFTVFDSTCFGFGCNSYKGVGRSGMAAPTDEASLPFNDFVAQLKDAKARAKVAKVDIYGADGSLVYVTDTAGAKIRLGEGLPVSDNAGWSDPLWLVRILDNNKVPHTYHFKAGDRP